jgi:hypothetical protein
MRHCIASVLSALLLVTAPLASAEGGIREQQVQFKKGESGATIKGSIKGQTVDSTSRKSPKVQSRSASSPTSPCSTAIRSPFTR